MGGGPDAGEDPPEDPQPGEGHGDDHDDHGHAMALGPAIGINIAINAVLNALSGYGIAWLMWKEYDLAWYSHEAKHAFEAHFVFEDVIVQGASTAIIVTLIVAAIMHRQWDGDHLAPGRIESLVLDDERTRGRHMAYWAGGTALGGAIFAALVAAIVAGGSEEVSGSAFAAARTINGLVVGGAVGGLITASWVTNFTAGRLVEHDPDRNTLGRLAGWSSANPLKVLAGVLGVTLLLGTGMADLVTDAEGVDMVPRGSEHAEAAQNLTEWFPSTYTQQAELQFRVDPSQCRSDSASNLPLRSPGEVRCGNITDEVYVRAMDEFFRFVRSYEATHEEGVLFWENETTIESPIRYQAGLPSTIKLANWTLAGGQDQAPDAAYALPPGQDRARWQAAEDTARELMAQTQDAGIDPSYDQAAVRYLVPPDADRSSVETGTFVLEARDAYLEWAPSNARWTVFTGDNKPLHTVDRPVANAHEAELVREDVDDLLPVAFGVVLVGLVAAFREPKSIAVAATTLTVGTVWTLGLVGHLEVGLTAANLVALTLVLGAGIDSTIHVLQDYRERKRDGLTDEEAFAAAGTDAGLSSFVVVLTAATGLGILALGPVRGLAELGLLAIAGISAMHLLAVTLVPAGMTLIGGTGSSGSAGWDARRLTGLGSNASHHRIFVALAVVGLTLTGFVGLQGLEAEAFGGPTQTWPEEDPIRHEHEAGLRGFHDLSSGDPLRETQAVVIEGNVTHPDALSYIEDLTASLQAQSTGSDALDARGTRDLPSTIDTWQAVCCGPQGAAEDTLLDRLPGGGGPAAGDEDPQTRAEVEQTLDDMFASPFAGLASPVVDHPSYNVTVTSVAVQTGDFDQTEQGWDTLTAARDRASDRKPDDVRTAFVGTTASSYLIGEEQTAWLVYGALAAGLSAVLYALAYTRDPRAALAVGTVAGLSSLLLLGALETLDVGLTVTLLAPLVITTALGSGYAVSMVWRQARTADPGRAFGAAGRAVLYSALTTVTALAVLLPIPGTELEGVQNLMVRDLVRATVAGLSIAFAVTLTVVPLVYDLGAEAETTDTEAGPEAETDAEPAP